jgi:HlyD family secretion protein
MRKITFFLSKKYVIIGLAIVVTCSFFIVRNGKNGKQAATAQIGDIVQEVTAAGKVKPNQSVELGFDKSGRVSRVNFSVGEVVPKGAVVASLETASENADLAKAKALLEEELINLRELKSTAPISFADAQKNLDASIREGFASADDAIRNKADQFFTNNTSNPKFEVTFTDGNYVHYFDIPTEISLSVSNERKDVEKILKDWQISLGAINGENIVSVADKSITDLKKILSFLDKVAGAINTFTPAEYSYLSTVNTYKTTAASARTQVSSAISSLVTAKDKFNSAPLLGETGEFEDVLAQEAKVSQARASVSAIMAEIGKSSIIAPFDGVIIRQDAKVGETVLSGSKLVRISSNGKMYIESNISEINIGKISQGNPAQITFDAFPGEVFSGSVSYIEPGEVVIDGVVNYKVRVDLMDKVERLKSGLTADIRIETSRKNGVVVLPSYAVKKDGELGFVEKMINGKTNKTRVELGLTGNNGMIEILSGVLPGESVQY